MSRHLLPCAAALLALLAVTASACSEPASADAPAISAERPLRIAATIKPIELIARDLVEASLGDLVTVTVLMTPDVSPHGFEPTAAQMATLRRADVVLFNGYGLDDWAVRDLPSATLTLSMADVADIDHDHHHHDHHHEHGHECDHGPVDEHFWLDVELASAFAAKVAAELGRRLGDVEHADAHAQLQSALAGFTAKALALDNQFREALSAHQGARIVTHHNVFSRIAERYGLGEPIVLRPVEMLEPTAGDIRRAIETIRAENINHIFIEPQFSAAAADRIREETGAALVPVDPLGSEATSWHDLMGNLLDALRTALPRARSKST